MNTKKSLKASGLSLVLCIAMLIGTTFAWFTDSITNSGNVIQAGNLKIDATAYDIGSGGMSVAIPGVNGGNQITFEHNGQNLKTDNTPIINEELFEPGKSNAKLLQVRNSGNLAAKIKIDFNVTDEGLIDDLWFDFVKVSDSGKLEGTFDKKPMSQLVKVSETVEIPLLKQGENVKFALVYGMNENAGNDAQNKSFAVDVTIMAKQEVKENDGFGNPNYDNNAKYEIINVSTSEELKSALENLSDGDTLKVVSNIEGQNQLTVKDSKSVKIDVKSGKTLSLASNNGGKSLFRVNNGSTLTLTGKGTITNEKNIMGSAITAFGNVTVDDDITISNEGSNSNMGAILVGDKGLVTIKNGTVKSDKVTIKNAGGKVYISGGTFTSKTNDRYNGVIFNGGTGLMEITGGTFNGNIIATSGIDQTSNLYIKDGTFKNGKIELNNGGKVEITGGTFENYSLSNIKAYLANGYEVQVVSDNVYKVIKSK